MANDYSKVNEKRNNEIMDSSFESNNTLKIVLNEAEALPPVVNDTGSVPNIEPETIFIWIDILGFSSLVENEARYNELLV